MNYYDIKEVKNKFKSIEKKLSELESKLEDNTEIDGWIQDEIGDLWKAVNKSVNKSMDEEEHDDYSSEEDIASYAYENHGLNSYTIGDGKGSALVIPLDTRFDETRYIKKYVNDFLS